MREKLRTEGQMRFPGAALIAFFIAGTTCLTLSMVGIYPLEVLAKWLSPDHQISPAFREILSRQQRHLGWAFAAGCAAIFFWSRLAWSSLTSLGPKRTGHAPLILAMLSGMLCLWVQSSLFQNVPHVTDATCHVFQAKIFSEGRLSAEAPACPAAFYQHNMVMTQDGRWFARYPPGTAGLIALGMTIGAEKLVLPALHAISVIALFYGSLFFFSRKTAMITAGLYAVSPLTLLLGASFMSHTPFMAAALSGLALFFHSAKGTAKQALRRQPFLAGLIFGSTILFRPQDTAIVLVMCGIGMLLTPFPAWRPIGRRLPFAFLGAIIPLSVFLLYNHQAYGTMLSTGYGFDDQDALQEGISVSFGLSKDYGLADATRNTLNILYKYNAALLG